MNRRLLNRSALVVMALIGAGSLSRLTTGGGAAHAALVTAGIGALVAAVTSWRASAAATLLISTGAVILTALWTAAPAATWHGLPSIRTFRVLRQTLNAVGGIHHLPTFATAGFVFVCALLAGMAGVVTMVLPGASGLLPALALVATSTIIAPSTGAAWLGVWLAVAGSVTVMSSSPERGGPLIGSLAALASVACLLVAGTATGATAVSGGGPRVVGVPPSALSLVSNLTGLETRDPNLVLFTASTPVPTYWQVATLSVLEGNTWVPDAETADALAGRGIPRSSIGPPTGSIFTVTVNVANLSSRLLPVPPSTVAASGAVLSTVGAVAARLTTPGQQYRAAATIPQVATDGGNTDGGSTATSTNEGDTSLPPISPVVSAVARSLTSSASSPLEKAETINNWLRSSHFHYSLHSSPTSLTAFLTSTHTGSCEQFAGAFAVLARAVGLPTRVAVGFSTGVRDAAGVTVVRGVDAHAWPEVLLGGSWISFEPTPQLPSGEIAPPGVIGTAALGTPNPIGPTTIPRATPPPSLVTPTPPSAVTVPTHHGVSWWLAAAGAAIVIVAISILARWRRGRRTPHRRLLLAWKRVDRALARGGATRPPWRTPTAHARLVGSRGSNGPLMTEDLEWLAKTLEEVTYGSRTITAHEAEHATAVSRQVSKMASATPR